MKTNMMRIAPVLVAAVICAWGTELRAQATTTTTSTATTVTTTKGAFTEFVPASQTIVVRTETNPAPLRYVMTKETTIVDEAGAPVTVEKISPGNPLSVHYTGTGDRLVASRIVVHKAPAPVVTDRPATTTTTTTTTRPLTEEEKKAVKKEVEKQKERADEAKDKAEDEDEDEDDD